MRFLPRLLVQFFAAADCVLLAILLVVVWAPPQPGHTGLIVLLLTVPFWCFLFKYFGLYESHRVEGIAGFLRKLASAQIAGTAVLGGFLLVIGQRGRLLSLLGFAGMSAGIIIVHRSIVYALLGWARRHGLDARNVCVIGGWNAAEQLQARFSAHAEWGLRVSCVGAGSGQEREYLRYTGREPISHSLEEVLTSEVVDEVVIAVPAQQLPQERSALAICEQYGVLGRVMLDMGGEEQGPVAVEPFFGEISLSLGRARESATCVVVKRSLDLLLGAALLLLFSPLLAVAALLVKVSSPGAVIYKQRRTGLHGRTFVMYKFRTMVQDAEGMLQSLAARSIVGGPIFKDRNDCRVTPIGRFLRRFSIDELPQLLNVVKGDMSLVGPRPLPVAEAARISGAFRRRFSMRPGITCLWQVNGRSNIEYAQWMSYDLQYVDGWSLWLDAKLLVRTIPAVLSGRGAY